MSLAFHAVVQLGCVCIVDRKTCKQGVKDDWSLEDVMMKTTAEYPYSLDSLSFVYLYHRFLSVYYVYSVYCIFYDRKFKIP